MKHTRSQQVIEIEGRFFIAPRGIAQAVECVKQGAALEQCVEPLRSSGRERYSDSDLVNILRDVLHRHGFKLSVVETCGRDQLIIDAAHQHVSRSAAAGKYLLISHVLVPQLTAMKLARLFTGMFRPPVVSFFLLAVVVLITAGLVHGGMTNPFNLSVIFDSSNETPIMAPYSVPIIIAIVFLCLLFHEIGHASAALRFGADVRSIGIGVYWIIPVLYSDVTSAWRLPPLQRVIVDAAGIYFQCIAIVLMEVMQLIILDKVLSEILAICIVYNMLIVIINLNPVLRFDGYWIFADFFDIPNLRNQANRFLHRFLRNLGPSVIRGSSQRRKSSNETVLFIYSALSLVVSVGFTSYLVIAMFRGYSHWPEMVDQLEFVYLNLASRNYMRALDSAMLSIKFIIPIVLFPILLAFSLSAMFRTFVRSVKSEPIVH